MRIESLFIEGFGRLVDRRFELGPGLNLFVGPNEAGKSTLQHFLVGMLYGQKRRGARREAAPEHGRFRPWSGVPYRGVLSYRLADGRAYRVERSFEPDRVQIWDAVTGEDLSPTFTMDRRKELLFAETHIGLSEEGFRSTAWVGQGAIGHLAGGAELAGRIANLQESGQEELSVRAAQEWLAAQAKQIGSDRAPTRPLAKAAKQLQELTEQLGRAEQVMEEVRGWEAEATEIAAILAGLAEEEESLERRLAGARLERLEGLQAQVEACEATLAQQAAYAAFPTHLSTRFEPLATELRWAETASTERSEAAGRARREAERFAEELGTLRHLSAERLQRLGSLPALLAERDRLRRNLSELRARIPEATIPQESGKGKGLIMIGGGLAILVAAFMLGMERPVVGLAVGLAGLLGLWLWQQKRPDAKAPVAAETERLQREGLQAQLSSLEAQIGDLAGDLGPAFLAGPDPAGAVQDLLGRQRAWTAAEAEAQEAALKAEGARRSLAAVQAELADLLAEAGVVDLTEFQAGIERARAYQEAKRALASLAPVLEGRSAADLAEEIALLRARVGPGDLSSTGDSPEALEASLRQIRQRLADRMARQERLRGQIETATGAIPETAELARQIAALGEQRIAMEEELAAIGLAQQVLGDVAEEMHREFAPRLARAMGALVEQLTGGRYNQVRVDESLDLRTIGPAERIVSVGALSAGTIDQFYLGLRIALLDMVAAEGEPIPLLLDDPFVSYDDERVRHALALLGEWAKERQILLLTCQERDLRAVQELNLPAHVIRLDGSPLEVDLSL
ncbi:MAG TPA: AAA family ATPase [Symbiobacteriaceae bacterium]|nr:AAA family ATPase [Symbiobacteriaceae bacterium]